LPDNAHVWEMLGAPHEMHCALAYIRAVFISIGMDLHFRHAAIDADRGFAAGKAI